MEQHAIPQNISSYQFRLVGDMTLKQFFQLAGGFLVALLFYSTPIIGIVKWPFVIVSAILGIALAFLPLEERPLERWIFAFFRAIYAPTMYFWKKTAEEPKLFQDEAAATEPAGAPTQQDAALKEYLGSASQKTGPMSKLEGAEKGFLSALAALFAGVTGQTTPATQQVAETPKVTEAVAIPQVTPTKIIPQTVPHLVVEERKQELSVLRPEISAHEVAPLVAGEEIISTKQAMFSVDAAPPNPPTTPNVIVGQVVDANRKIIEGAIMEIKDASGRPTRALRSNRAGHFITVTPLENGRYDIITDKEGYEFTPVSFDAIGQLIPPILVQGRMVSVPEPIVNSQQVAAQQQ